jgi:hypothetical protein
MLIGYFVLYPTIAEGKFPSEFFLPARLAQMALATFVSAFSVAVFFLIARPDRASVRDRDVEEAK